MNLLKIIEALRTKTMKKIAYAALILIIVIDFFIPRHEVHFFGDRIPGFWSLFGYVACILIILISKWIGHLGIMQDENYYNE
jgi:uncharacterized membrane protein YfhO